MSFTLHVLVKYKQNTVYLRSTIRIFINYLVVRHVKLKKKKIVERSYTISMIHILICLQDLNNCTCISISAT